MISGNLGFDFEEQKTERNWILTYTGRKYYPLTPESEDVHIADIAHSLALQNRYTGHVRVPYSVAHHSVLVAQNLPDELKLAGLLHDAAETYCSDFSAPIKHSRGFREYYGELEERNVKAIAKKFDLEYPVNEKVKEVDKLVLQSELYCLMPYHPDIDYKKDILKLRIIPVSWQESETMFLSMFNELYKG